MVGRARAKRRKMLTAEEIQNLLKGLTDNFGGTWGYAGSYARGEATSKSDIDLVYQSLELDLMQYVDVCNYVERKIPISYDIINLKLCREDDEELDQLLLSDGLDINDHSCYKNVCREVKWYEKVAL